MLQNQGINRAILLGRVCSQPKWRTISGSEFLCIELVTNELIGRGSSAYYHEEKHLLQLPFHVLHENVSGINENVSLYIEGKVSTLSNIDKQGIRRYDTTIIVGKYNVMNTTNAIVAEM